METKKTMGNKTPFNGTKTRPKEIQSSLNKFFDDYPRRVPISVFRNWLKDQNFSEGKTPKEFAWYSECKKRFGSAPYQPRKAKSKFWVDGNTEGISFLKIPNDAFEGMSAFEILGLFKNDILPEMAKYQNLKLVQLDGSVDVKHLLRASV